MLGKRALKYPMIKGTQRSMITWCFFRKSKEFNFKLPSHIEGDTFILANHVLAWTNYYHHSWLYFWLLCHGFNKSVSSCSIIEWATSFWCPVRFSSFSKKRRYTESISAAIHRILECSLKCLRGLTFSFKPFSLERSFKIDWTNWARDSFFGFILRKVLRVIPSLSVIQSVFQLFITLQIDFGCLICCKFVLYKLFKLT